MESTNMKQKPATLEFQILDWNSYHEMDEDEEDRYVIQLFGRTEDDKDVCLKVTDFTPYFYVEVPSNWTSRQADLFVTALRRAVSRISNNHPDYHYDLSESLTKYMVVQKHKFYNFTNKKLFKFILLVFKSQIAMREFSNILARPLIVPGMPTMLYQRYESNIEPHLRFMHINDLSSCGWVSIEMSKLKELKNYSYCDLSYQVNWKEVKPSMHDNRMAPFKIMGYDIECVSGDANFPQAERKTDKIIQIGITMYRYGSLHCYEQHILTLGKCSPIEGATVECYKTEKGLIRGFARKIREIRPDFKVGYNNFGFDDSYIYERINQIDKWKADKLGTTVNNLPKRFLDEILEMMGKVNNKYLKEVENVKKPLTYFMIKNLSSSALGDNELRFFQIPGILSVDMMKVIQRDHRLESYKLDSVSAVFIAEGGEKFVFDPECHTDEIPLSIYTNSTKALEKESYIQIMVNDGYSPTPLNEGAKYRVLDINTVKDIKDNVEKTYQCIKTTIHQKDLTELTETLKNPRLQIYWTFAKDDMHHTTINQYFAEGDPQKIRIVAKYCLKDCKLVNLLLAKLEIIVNSVGMAKVCHVPLSYLFLRGQGVKIFSLVAKKCRQRNFLVPVLRSRNKDLDGEDLESYEGATVIKPVPGVYLSPIGVLDYNSLYPNSMRERNLTPECYVNDPQYDHLPGYIYHDVYIMMKDKKGKVLRNLDGTPKQEHHRFAQEIISEEQIREEMKDIINQGETNVNKIADQIYLDEASRKIVIDGLKEKLEKLSENNGSQKEIEKKIQKLIDQATAIEKLKKEVAEEIKKIQCDDSLSPDKRKSQMENLTNTMIEKIDSLNRESRITDLFREILIKNAKAQNDKRINDEKMKRYNISQGKVVRYGILPEILTELLNARKATNEKLKVEKDPFVSAILDSLQKAYKITANSLYGQTGAPTSPIYFIAIAASTTAIGRERLYYAKAVVEENFPQADVIYGDTDSIFINFHIKDETGKEITNKEALVKTIEAAKKAANIINSKVPKPQVIAYEKTLHPFILITKKKYVGVLYNENPDKGTLKAMGIVLKRRDYAPIVKIVVGSIIDYILNHQDTDKAITYTQETLARLMSGGYPIEKFIISKTLKSKYKKPSQIAHKVLADRMAIRDPGNKPQINDRIPYVYVVKDLGKKKKKDILQGDLIEHPEYVIKNNLQIDYLYYLEHQIINPAMQILELLIPTKEVEKLFNKFIIQEQNRRNHRQSMEKWMDGVKLDENKISKVSRILNRDSLPEYAGKKKLDNQSLDKWITYQKEEATFTSQRKDPTDIPIYAGKKKHLTNKSMDKWLNNSCPNKSPDWTEE